MVGEEINVETQAVGGKNCTNGKGRGLNCRANDWYNVLDSV